jgi:hypothetical protein
MASESVMIVAIVSIPRPQTMVISNACRPHTYTHDIFNLFGAPRQRLGSWRTKKLKMPLRPVRRTDAPYRAPLAAQPILRTALDAMKHSVALSASVITSLTALRHESCLGQPQLHEHMAPKLNGTERAQTKLYSALHMVQRK